MEAGRLVDALGLRPNYEIQQSDAVRAYLQATTRGTPTWLLLPRDQWPAARLTMKKPVCGLNVALYGHPDSGTDWEYRCDESLKKSGFANVGDGARPSCYVHKELGLLRTIE